MELQADGSKSWSVDTTGKIWKFRWMVKNLSGITDKKLYSEDFVVDGNKWRILIYPKGKDGDHLSIYLAVADSATLPSGWRRHAQFGLAVIDQIDRKTSITKVATHVFNAKEVDRGFTSFLSLAELHNPRRGYLINDACLLEAYVSTDTTTGLISHELIVKTDSAIGNEKTTITRPVEITAPSSSRPSFQIVDLEPEEPTKEDMNTFFTSLESALLSSNTVFSQEEAKEAWTKLEAALNMTPISFHDSREFSPLKLAFKILASVGCSSTNLTIEQKNKLLAMEESLKQLSDRAAKAVEDKNRLTAKESIKNTVTYNLECSLIRYKEVESEVKQVEQKLTALQEQVEEAQKKRESMLVEQKGIFKSSQKMKMELEALSKEWAECEAKAKVAEDEEKTVEAEWGRMKHFISSIKEDVKRALEEQYGGKEEEDNKMLVPNNDFIDGPQPLEGRFTWTVENFSRLNTKKLYSEIFFVGGYKWRILIFPKGNNVDCLSMYLDVADSETLPYGWSKYARFSLAVCHQIHNKYTIRKDTEHQFNARESDWGFTSFMPLGELYDPHRGYLVNDTIIVEAEVDVSKVGDDWSHDSKKETGYVGLKNQGATGYMNSLLQTLYHIPYFRRAMYHMPTTENDIPTGCIPLALQRLFYKLQYSETSVATKELTKSFGWGTCDSFIQHDVQELNRVLSEKLEDKMKGTVVEGTIQQLFEGHRMNYIECINVDYKSTRKESFYDLQLDVKGCKDVYASFDKYVEVECLEGDNKYHAEQYGLQDARKGVLFIDFPPVLQLQLKRFEYDSMQDTVVKINDIFEFPLQLDLDREYGKYLSPEADRSIRNLYTLHSVLAHSDGAHGEHYYAYIRPTLSDQWFKFDDERVTEENVKRALEGQYGGDEELPQTNPGFSKTPFKFTKYSNAYLLVYIRESDKDKIICNVDEKDIAEHLRIRLKKEQEEKEQKRKEKAKARLYTVIKVARNEDLAEQIGRDIYFDLVDHEKVRSFQIQNQMPFNVFKEEVAKEFGIPVQYQRFWLWAKRQNHTYRPNRPLTHQEEAQSVGQLREVPNKINNAELKLFLEVELGPHSRPVAPPENTKEDIFLFFKLYDPYKEELRYIGRMFVKVAGKPMEILARINKMAGFDPDEEIELYEEIRFEPSVRCDHIDKTLTFRTSQLENGDIICLQKFSEVLRVECRYPNLPSFLEYVHNRQSEAEARVAEVKTDKLNGEE
ncbi:hypothetical protein V6N11_054168 [Hibiscus sabdariffa]|uniref:Ubiquitinyl hydrolase 1 n=1 Tax=Hibiscus sabdariffa TaxID=183260 RepID=A0ABR2S3K4_9ROSI